MNLSDVLMMLAQNTQGLEKEQVTFVKNGILTTVTVYFSSEGIPVKTFTQATNVNTELQQIEVEMKEALEKEDYPRCAKLKKRKEELLGTE